MIELLIGGAILFGLFAVSKAHTSTPPITGIMADPAPPHVENKFGLDDVEPEDQGGNYTREFDDAFIQARESTGVPFALMKAHAIRESRLKPRAVANEPGGKQSYGLMQILWWKGSNRFAQWGYNADTISDGSMLYDPLVNTYLGGMVIADNLSRLGLRDSVNAYNTGVKESVRVAPNHYTDDVLKYYAELIG